MASRTSQQRFSASSHFTFRTPLLPFRAFADWAHEVSVPGLDADESTWRAAVATALPGLRARLAAVLRRPRVRDALFLASPGLEEQVAEYLAAPHTDRARKVEFALIRYFARMAGRATPFGLFSGISVGRVDATTDLALLPLADYERHTRLDNDYLFALTDALVRDPAVRAKLIFWPNDSLYRSAGRLRYVEARLDGKRRSHHLVRVDPDEYLDATLTRAESGASADFLAEELVADDPEIELEEALGYIDDLIDSQVLVSRLTPAVTGVEPVHGIVERLAPVARSGVIAAELAESRLIEVSDELRRLDQRGLGAEPDIYRDIARRLAPLPAPVDIARLFQVDMVKPAPTATLGAALISELERGIELLNRISMPPAEDPLDRFREQFQARYEDREVPLLKALDEDSGIGFMASGDIAAEPSPLLQGLVFPTAPSADVASFNRWHGYLARRIHGLRKPSDGPLQITATDISKLELPAPRPMPDAFSAMATLAAPSQEALQRGEMTVYLMNAGGPSGARLTGRFCHASVEVERAVRDHLRAEEALNPEAVFAEIVHLPEGRSGNILCRPVLRAYEIPYLGLSGAAPEQLLPLSDLTVSIVGRRVTLRSRRLQKQVIPRLSTAHNLSLGVGVYRFLGYLQSQGLGAATWSWGPLTGLPYLPRVESGRLILQRARWTLDANDLAELVQAARTDRARAKRSKQQKSVAGKASAEQQDGAERYERHLAAVFRAMQGLRARFELPRFVALLDGDNELPIDLDNPLSCASCAQIVKSRTSVSLSEFFPRPEQTPCHGPEGSYVTQIVVPFVRREARVRPVRKRSPVNVERSFAPGSEWLYAKLYAGTGTVDRLLCETIAPFTRRVIGAGIADRWFFIRYRDPDHHLRVRWHGTPARLSGELLPALHEVLSPLLAGGSLWSVQLDTYQRELERYGGEHGIELAEALFAVDSDAVVDMLPYLTGDSNADGRWQMAVVGTDALLDDMGFDIDQKFAIMSALRDGFGSEFHADPKFYRRIGAPFRERQKSLRELMAWDFRSLQPMSDVRPLDGARGGGEVSDTEGEVERIGGVEGDDDYYEEAEEEIDAMYACGLALRRRSERTKPIAVELRRRAQASLIVERLAELVPSYVHMYLNRLFRSAQRAQELIIYDYLRRLYASERARRGKRNSAGGG